VREREGEQAFVKLKLLMVVKLAWPCDFSVSVIYRCGRLTWQEYSWFKCKWL